MRRIELCRVQEEDFQRIKDAAGLVGRSVSDYGTRTLSAAAQKTIDETCTCDLSPYSHPRSPDCEPTHDSAIDLALRTAPNPTQGD